MARSPESVFSQESNPPEGQCALLLERVNSRCKASFEDHETVETDGRGDCGSIPIDEAAGENIRRLASKTHNILFYLPDIRVPPALSTHPLVHPGPIVTRSCRLRLDPRGLVVSDGG